MKHLIRLCFSIMLLVGAPASAQMGLMGVGGGGGGDNDAAAPEITDTMTQTEARELVSRLSDREVRDLLLRRLDAVAEQNQAGRGAQQSFSEFVIDFGEGIRSGVVVAVTRLPNLVSTQSRAFANFYLERGRTGTAKFVMLTVFAALIGLLGAFLTYRISNRWRERVARAPADLPLSETLKLLGVRLLLDISGLVVLVILSGLMVKQFMAGPDKILARLLIVSLVALPMLMSSLSRFLLAPYRPLLRLVNTDNRTAMGLHRHQMALFFLLGVQIAIQGFNHRNGVPMGELRLGFWFFLLTLGYVGFLSWRFRFGMQAMMRGWDDEVSRFEERMARAYPFILIGLCVMTWLLVQTLVYQGRFDLLSRGAHYQTLLLVAMAPALDTMVRGLVRHLAPPMEGEGALAEEAYIASKRSYVRIGRALVFGLIVFLIAGIWRIDFQNLATAGLGAQAAARFIAILIIFGVGFLVFEVVTLWINRKLANEQTAAGIDLNAEEPGGGEGGALGGSRLSTVLPLIRWLLQSTIITITLLIALGNIGIDITPLLAGAGIVGIAIGFGAQRLVSDIVSGIFFLIDDAFRAGEYVEIAGTLGTVEKISLRSVQLRHHRGAVHTIPFGEIPRITNYSRDWVIMKLKFTVPFDTDLKKVKDIFKKIGKEIEQIPEFADDMMQPFKSQGVLEVDDVGIVVRGKFMARPGKQFPIRKEIYGLVQKEFDANGIQFARREVRVNLNEGNSPDLTDKEREAVAHAAADAARPPEPAPTGS